MSYPVYKEIKRYSITGLINTVLGYSVIFLLMFIGVNVFISNIVGYLNGLISSFYFNRNWVFQKSSENEMQKQLYAFIYAFIFSYTANIIMLYILINIHMNPYAAQIVASFCYMLVFYCINKYHVFK